LPTVIAEPQRKTTFVYNGDSGTTCGYKADGVTLVPGVLCSVTVQATTDTTGGSGTGATTTGSPRTWAYTYNPEGQVLTVNGPRTDLTDTTTYTYHANNATCTTGVTGASTTGCRGQVATVTNALSHVTQIDQYNAHGQPLKITDPNGLVTTLAYDTRTRLTSRDVGGEVTGYTYDSAGQLTKITLPDSSAVEYIYDNAHRLTEVRLKDSGNTLIGKTTYTLDAMGNSTADQVLDGSSTVLHVARREYNTLNRLTKHMIGDIAGSSPSSRVTTQYAYDNQGNLTTVTGPLSGATRTQTYDALNRLATMVDPTVTSPSLGGGTTTYTYDGLDQLASVTDARTFATTYTNSGLGDLTQQVSPDTGTTANTHDAAGNVLTSTDAKSQQTTYIYDALNRVSTITYGAASGGQLATVAYTYDSTASGNYGVGRLTQIVETAANSTVLNTIQYTYNQKGRLTSEARTFNSIAYTTSYGYDSAGRLTSITYPGGRQVTYTLDGLGRIQQIDTTKSGTTQTVLSSATYRPFGPVTGFTFGNSQAYTRSFDSDGFGRITAYTQATQTIPLCYDTANRITGLSGAAACAGGNAYTYDEMDRLISAVTPANTQAYVYDKVGNRTSQTVGANTNTLTFSGSSNRLSGISGILTRTYSHDNNGSVTGDGTNTLAYDPRGRLTQWTGSINTSYQLDSLGQRVRKTSSLGDTVYHYDVQGRLISETDPSGTVLKEYIYLGNTPVGVLQ